MGEKAGINAEAMLAYMLCFVHTHTQSRTCVCMWLSAESTCDKRNLASPMQNDAKCVAVAAEGTSSLLKEDVSLAAMSSVSTT